MKATIEIELKPFMVPNFVSVVEPPGKREEGFKEGMSYPLSAIGEYTLDRMCDNFRSEVFKKAGKNPPPTAR